MLGGCSLGSRGEQGALPYMQSGNALRALDSTGAGKITHIVYIVQENRSFNNLFYGYPGAYTVTEGKDSKGRTIKLKPSKLGAFYDIDHSVAAMVAACNGTGKLPGTDCRMNGFDQEWSDGGFKNSQYVYVPHDQSKPYFDMAHEGALADRMFQSQLDESFVAHQYVIAAQAAWSADLPSGYWGCEDHEASPSRNDHHAARRHRLSEGVLRLSNPWRRTRQGEALVALLCQPVWRGSAATVRRGRAIKPSNTSTTDRIGRKTSFRPTGSLSPTSARDNSRTLRGSRPSATTPTTPTARMTTDRRGSRRS